MANRDEVAGISAEARAERKQALSRLIELFDGNDAEEEIRRLKREDECWGGSSDQLCGLNLIEQAIHRQSRSTTAEEIEAAIEMGRR